MSRIAYIKKGLQMNKTDFQILLAYVSPFYDEKDILHDLEHVERMIYGTREILQAEKLNADFSLLIYGAYFHGLSARNLSDMESFLVSHDLPFSIARIAVESLGKSVAETLEGKILSDAHTLEGGRYIRYLKPLLTGTYLHQSLDDTMLYIEENEFAMKCEFPPCI